MKFVVLVVLAIAVLAQADRSKVKPKELRVEPLIPAPLRSRIVGGQEAVPHQFPYQVGLFINEVSFCGGSILDSKTILTAAHCADGATSIEVVAGAHQIREIEPDQQSIVSNSFTIHQNWNPSDVTNDIALIHLPTPLTINDNVQSIPISNTGCPDSSTDGATATVSGWGKPSDSATTISPVLRWVQEQTISNDQCNVYFNIKDTHICLNGFHGMGSCNGDSGGPLTINGEEAGIVSFGSAWGCEIGFPSVYTRVSCYVDWINANK